MAEWERYQSFVQFLEKVSQTLALFVVLDHGVSEPGSSSLIQANGISAELLLRSPKIPQAQLKACLLSQPFSSIVQSEATHNFLKDLLLRLVLNPRLESIHKQFHSHHYQQFNRLCKFFTDTVRDLVFIF